MKWKSGCFGNLEMLIWWVEGENGCSETEAAAAGSTLFWLAGQIPESKQEQRFLAHLWPEIEKLCMVRSYVIIEEMMAAAKDVEKMLGELGKTPFDLLKEEQEEDMIVDAVMEKQVNVIMWPLKILLKVFHLM